MLPVWLKYNDYTLEMDAGCLFSVLPLLSLQSSSWWRAGLWSVPSVPKCHLNLISFVYLPQILSDGFWRVWTLSLVMDLVHMKHPTYSQVPSCKSSYLQECCLWNREDTFHKSCNNVLTWGSQQRFLFSVHCEFQTKANAALMENAKEKSKMTYCWF